MRKKQRYRCKKCNYLFTEGDNRKVPDVVKKLAIHMYLEGLGFRSIERVLGVSNVVIMNWVKSLAKTVETVRKSGEIDKKPVIRKMELDEMWHCVGKKNGNYGYGLLLIEILEKSWNGNLVVVGKKLAESFGRR